ncbi:MAG: prepilin-type N-terminal cleavage/methylation domain-containing protein [bacterium]
MKKHKFKSFLKHKTTTTGFTLLEIAIVVAISSIIILLIGAFSRNIFFIKNYVQESYTSEGQSKAIIRPMATEIRSIRASMTGAYGIEQAGTSTFIFFSDIDLDGSTELVHYFVSGDYFKKGVIKATGTPITYPANQEKFSTLIEGLRNTSSTPVFQYYPDTYTGSSTPLTQPVNIQSINLIKINLVTDIDINRAPYQQIFTTQISIRNFKDNY